MVKKLTFESTNTVVFPSVENTSQCFKLEKNTCFLGLVKIRQTKPSTKTKTKIANYFISFTYNITNDGEKS